MTAKSCLLGCAHFNMLIRVTHSECHRVVSQASRRRTTYAYILVHTYEAKRKNVCVSKIYGVNIRIYVATYLRLYTVVQPY